MIKSLLVLEPDDSEQKTLPSVFHIGESHCLSFAHRLLKIRKHIKSNHVLFMAQRRGILLHRRKQI